MSDDHTSLDVILFRLDALTAQVSKLMTVETYEIKHAQLSGRVKALEDTAAQRGRDRWALVLASLGPTVAIVIAILANLKIV